MRQKKLMLLGGIRYLLPVIESAHREGHYVITADYLPDNIAHKYSDEYLNISIVDKDAVLSAALEKEIDGIMSFGVDPGVVSAAYVAEKMGLPFQCSYEAAVILQNKAKFRDFLYNNGFNCPKAKSYDNADDAIEGIESFTLPVIIKPVDSAGSKGVTKVDDYSQLKAAINNALTNSLSGSIIIEKYLDIVGAQSSADIFTIDGELVYPIFSDQLFDAKAANPYTPAIEIWPSTMGKPYQDDLNNQLQRMITLLGMKTGIYNVESRVCSDGKAYIMEISPRGGGNRIAELQYLATGQDLIKNEINKALGLPLDDIKEPKFEGVWCNYIIHSNKRGVFQSIEYDPVFYKQYVRDEGLTVERGDIIEPFTGANNSLGTLFLQFDSRYELNKVLHHIEDYISISFL